MSWAVEEWKEGLPTRALQKVQELEGQLDKLKKERQQRQFQLETLEAALQKQKQKVENEKTEATNLKRENQSLMEACENLEKAKQKISHELQVKESQVNFQEGQLSSTKKQIEKLEQELKRCKSELERSQQAAQSADVSLNPCNTPQKVFTTPVTPSQYFSGSKYEDLKEKYNKEVEERKRLEAEVKALQAKKASQVIPQNTMNHRDIARHQASSSVFSWQQEKTPSRLSSNAHQTPIRRDSSASHFPGEQEMTPSRWTSQGGRRETNSSVLDNHSNSHLLDQYKAQNQELRSKVGELELRLHSQEKDLKGQVNKWQELQLQLEKAKMELNEREKVLNKSRDELVRTAAQYDQVSAKCTALEQKLKKLTEDLSCQRQNAESARCSQEQKLKEKEKEFQEELSRQQRSLQTLDQECAQLRGRLTQELQQAKSANSGLQAELNKVTSVKQQLERKLEELKQNFIQTEQALQASQSKENALRRGSEETKRENSFLKSQSAQSAQEVCRLQEELERTKQCLSRSQSFAEEMRAKNTSQEAMLRELQEKISQQENSLTLEKLKRAVADLEKQRDCSQDLLKKREHHIEQLSQKLSKTERESEALLSALELKKKEFEELREEKTLFSRWKSESEQLVKQMESEKESLQSKINQLESCLKAQQIKSNEYHEKVSTLEMEREKLSVEVRNLHNVVDSRAVEVATQRQAYIELQQKAELSDQKHKKEMENMCLQVSELTGQVEDLKHQLHVLSSEMVDKDQRYQDLHSEYENLRYLLKPGDSLVTSEAHSRSLLASEQQSLVKDSFADILGEQGRMPSGGSSQEADQSPKGSAVLLSRVTSLEFSLESQKQVNSDLQKQCEELVQIRGEIEENLVRAEQMHQSFVAETSQRISKLQEDTSAHQSVVAETLRALESKDRELQLLNGRLEGEQAQIRELEKNNHMLQESLKELRVLSETLTSEKKEMSSMLSLSKKEVQELMQENGSLKELNAAFSQEKMDLLQKSKSFSQCIVDREKRISELSNQYEQERLTLLQRCEETRNAHAELSDKYKAAQEANSRLECMLQERTSACEDREGELGQLKEALARERQAFVTQLTSAEERNQHLIQELGLLRQDLQAEITEIQNNSKKEADSLKQEIITLKEERSKRQKEISALLQEKEQLTELMEMKHEHQNRELDLVSDSVTESDTKTNKGHVQLPMELEVKKPSQDSYNAHLKQLEAKVRSLELKLEGSEQAKECLWHELATTRRELESGSVQQDPRPQVNGLRDSDVDAKEKSMSELHEPSASHGDSMHLQRSLQMAVSTLNALETMCETLCVGKFDLVPELKDSRSGCVTAACEMAEDVETLVKEVKTLNDENGCCQDESGEEMPEGNLGEQQSTEMSVSFTPDGGNVYEHLTLSNKEVQAHFAELQEKFSSLQSEHKLLHDQHSQMRSKMSELQSYVDTLKAENSVLSMSLRSSQGDLVKNGQMEPGEGQSLSLSFSCVANSPGLTSLGELSFCKDLLEQTGEYSLLTSLEGNGSANQSNLEASCSSLGEEEEDLSKKAISPVLEKSIEEPEVLCQMYLQSLKKLEEKIESQEILKNKEIEELEQLLSSERRELDRLRKQHLAENEEWQQRLASLAMEMESRLAAEKKQTEHLLLELEVARLQLQGLDLSTQSLLGADAKDTIRGGNDSRDTNGSEECPLESKERTPEQDVPPTCDKDVQQDCSPEMEKVARTGVVMLAGEGSSLQRSPESSSDSLVEDKTQDSSECTSELSFSGPTALVPVDFLGTQVTIQNLQLQVKETADENLRLLCAIEERDKNVEILLSEIKELDSKLNLQEVQLTAKIEMCRELGETVEELKKEKSDLMEKLESFSCDNPEFQQRGESSGGPSSSLEMGTAEWSPQVTEDDAAKMKDNWRERFLDVENELKKIKSEKGSLEHCVDSVAADLVRVQTEKQRLEKDSENKQQVISRLEEELSVVISERNRLSGELETLSKENKEVDLMSEKVKEEMQELESRQGECLRHIDVAEAEVKDNMLLLQTLSSDVSELLKEKAHLQEQLQSLEKDSQALSVGKSELENQIGQLNKEKESLVRESRSLQDQLLALEQEKLAVSKALEAAVMEKGEVAVRLSSTQDEVHQLRSGIEKLRVRIEADEKKQLCVLEKLKESERKNDSLQDKVENLERELQAAEENQEMLILDSENSKAEVETLKTQTESMTERLKALESDLLTVRSEKENLTQQLQEKQCQVSELDILLSSFKNLVEEKEQEKMQVTEESKAAAEMLEAELKELSEAVAALCGDPEARKVREQGLGPPAQAVLWVRDGIGKLRVRLEAGEREQSCILGKLQESEHQADLLKDRVKNLERELEMSRKKHEHATLEAENSQAEVEILKAKIEEMTLSLKDLEIDLVNLRSKKESLSEELQKEQGRASELEILNSSFENQLQEKEQENIRLKEDSKIVEERLQMQVKELKEKVAALCDNQETWKAKEQCLSGQVDHLEQEKSQLLQGLAEAKSNYIILQASVNGLIQEAEDSKQKLGKRDEEISVLKNQIQDQEQLVSTLSQLEREQQGLKKQKAELESLTVELEQRVRGLRSENDTLQDTLEVLQNSYRDLEEKLKLSQVEKMSLVEKVDAMALRETELQREVHEVTQKMTALGEELSGEKRRLTEELNSVSKEMKNSKGQLKEFMLENSELKRSLDCIHKDQMEKQEKMREEIAEYQRQLQEAEKKHQMLLLDTNKQHEMEIQAYREELTCKEECLSSQKMEIDCLKSSKEELNNSLKANTELLEELKKTKMDNLKHANQLKKEKERAQGKVKLLIKSFKQLEEEKKLLQKELSRLEEAVREKQRPGTVDANVCELLDEVKELKGMLEGKSKEAEEYLDKYCSLLISHEKLERAKEMLETQVARLSSQQPQPAIQSSLLKSVDPESPPVPPSVTEKPVSSGQSKASGKRQRSSGVRESGGGAAPSTPDMFPKRSRKVVRGGDALAKDLDDLEFEPEGLPEVVKKGFADIPTGKTSPYVLRRTTMATRTSPRLAAQKLAPSPTNIHKENHNETARPSASGNRSQKVKVAQQSPEDPGAVLRETLGRPLSASNLPERHSAGSPREGLRPKRGQPEPSLEAGAQSNENCRVQ